ncbi:MAG: MogA/MoaB family molybdenum cofactor biosynthesis protein [Synergistaceae bacterium]|jgi:molybdenum cofactor synthesis domain-containing protein|nr:MogA/MoaB family molybdenum cofactor biosynthesis protein [Synergistaceae bacterium]
MNIILRVAGEAAPEGSDFRVIVPPDMKYETGDFLSVNFGMNPGETMLRIQPGSAISVVCPGFIGASARTEVLRPIRTGVLTVSDRGYAGERTDTAGPALEDLAAAIGAVAERRDIVPDEREIISRKLVEWADSDALELIMTTGGTGLSPRDVTPEALTDIGDRIAPGFGEVMRARSMYYTPRGYLGRGIAVTRGKTLIIAFPGSERAVRQCFEAIAPALRHGAEILSGRDAGCGGH